MKNIWDSISQNWSEYRKNMPMFVKNFEKKGLILDLGCGSGRNIEKNNSYICCDFSIEMLRKAVEKRDNQNIEAAFVLCKAEELPFKNTCLDSAMMIAVLHYSKEREKCVEELVRVMKPDSKSLISVWKRGIGESFVKWNYNGKSYDRYFYGFSEDELNKILTKSFDVVPETADLKALKKNIILIVRKRG